MTTGNDAFDEMMRQIREESGYAVHSDLEKELANAGEEKSTEIEELPKTDDWSVQGVIDALVTKGWDELVNESQAQNETQNVSESQAEEDSDDETITETHRMLGRIMQERDIVKFADPLEHHKKHAEIFSFLLNLGESGVFGLVDVPYALLKAFSDCLVYDEAVILAELFEDIYVKYDA